MQQFTSRESDVAAQPDIVSWQPLTPHSLAVADPTGIPATERDSIEDRGIQDPPDRRGACGLVQDETLSE